MSVFQILDTALVPLPDNTGFMEYGNEAILAIADHFYLRDSIDEKEKLKKEWEKMKYYVTKVVLSNMPTEVTSNCTSTTPTD